MGLKKKLERVKRTFFQRLFKLLEKKDVRIGIYGPTNTGKCLAKGEKILLPDENGREISSFYEDITSTGEIKKVGHEEYMPLEACFTLPSLNKRNLKVEHKPVLFAYKKHYEGKMFQFKTELDRNVTVSPNHPFIVRENGNVRNVVGKLLRPGDKVPVISHLSSANRSVGWDEIAEVNEVEYKGDIYDLTVQDNHTFSTYDGLIVHNTTLANRIAGDWSDANVGEVTEIPHETRRIQRERGIVISGDGNSLTLDIVDTPGVATKVNYKKFMDFGLSEKESKRRAREATEGVIDSIRELSNVDAVLFVLDSTDDPFTQTNITILGNLEAQKTPFIVVANKIDLSQSDFSRIKSAFPQYQVVPISARDGQNLNELYNAILKNFG